MKKKDVINKIPIYKLKSPKELLDYYTNWTSKKQYNKDMIDWEYTAPKNTVSVLKKYAPNKNIKILDAGCGSGLVGIELIKNGYFNVEGTDFSKSMLDLIPKDVYKNIKIADLNKPLAYKDQEFDSVLCVGTFTYGHVKPLALNEFIRITKKNGLICFTVNEGVYKENGFEQKIHELEIKGSWIIKELFMSDFIRKKNVNSWMCVAMKII